MSDLLDLHGCRLDEVDDKVDRFLMKLSSSNLKRARIMTGKGTGVIQKAVMKYLKAAGYPYSFEKSANGKPNEGCLIVFLD